MPSTPYDFFSQQINPGRSQGYETSKLLPTPPNYDAQIQNLQARIAALPPSGTGYATEMQRYTLTRQLSDLKAKRDAGTAGITPAPDAAPVLGIRIQQPKVGFDALKIFLPTSS